MMFGLMTTASHREIVGDMRQKQIAEMLRQTEALSEAERKCRELDALASKFQDRVRRLQIDNDALTAEVDRLRPIAEKAEARKAQALANLKQNRRAAA
jgi:septal ring factor EnvC (AmiA/AmiB activator)